MNPSPEFRRSAACAAVLSVLVGTPATSLAGSAGTQAQVPAVETQRATGRILLTAGQSTVLLTDYDIVRIAVNKPEVADARVVDAREILIDGRAAGTVSLIVWGTDRRVLYDIVVDAGGSPLQRVLREVLPGEDVQVRQVDEGIVLSGTVSNEAAMLRAIEVAGATSPKSRVINMMQMPGVTRSQQVLLQVRFAEVSRRAVTELGVSFFLGPTGSRNYFGRGTTQQFAAPDLDEGKWTFSDLLNLFVFDSKANVGALIRALEGKGFFQSLAEPNLIAYNGQEASFLAGGEFPIPVLQGVTGAVTIIFKEFGVRLTFLPVIAGDVIRLKVTPEVSTLDFATGVTVGGFAVPSLITRRADTSVELRDGQSFVIAGLLSNAAQEDKSAIPFLSKIPIIGNLFKSKANRAEETELMVLITPRLVRPLDPDEVPPLPTLPGKFLSPRIGSQLEGGGGLLDGPVVQSGGEAAKPAEKPKPPAKRN